jgi:surface antigen
MKKLVIAALLSATILNLSGCAGGTSNQNIGVGGGALIGGLLGSQFGQGSGAVAATIGGAVLGGLLGGAVGKNMDDVDRQKMNSAVVYNQPTRWRNTETGNSYYVQPRQTFRTDNGELCREYITTAVIGGKKQQLTGQACRQADGSWKMISQD